MLIYAVADIHGQRERLKRIEDIASRMAPDVLVIAGDITAHPRDRETLQRLDGLSCPVLFVPGNVDPTGLDETPDNAQRLVSVYRKGSCLQGHLFYGPLASAPKNGGGILVSHYPPWGILDTGFGGFPEGSREIRRYALEQRPGILICGHIHEQRGVALLDGTLVVNCSMGATGNGALLKIEKNNEYRAELLP